MADTINKFADRVYLGMLSRRHNMPLLLYSLLTRNMSSTKCINVQADVWTSRENTLCFPTLYFVWDTKSEKLVNVAEDFKILPNKDSMWVRAMRLQSLFCKHFLTHVAVIPGTFLIFSIQIATFTSANSAPVLCEYTALLSNNHFSVFEKSGSLQLVDPNTREHLPAVSNTFMYRKYNTEQIGLLPLTSVQTCPCAIEFLGKKLDVSEKAIAIAKSYNCMHIPVAITGSGMRVICDSSTMVLGESARVFVISNLVPLNIALSPVKVEGGVETDMFFVKNGSAIELPPGPHGCVIHAALCARKMCDRCQTIGGGCKCQPCP